MQDSKTVQEMVINNPQAALRHFARMEMYMQALESSIKAWAELNGDFVSSDKSVKYQRRTRTNITLDSEKAASILESQGFDLMDIAEIKLTENSIIAKLGEVEGNKVISELMQAGAFKKFETKYWRLQVK